MFVVMVVMIVFGVVVECIKFSFFLIFFMFFVVVFYLIIGMWKWGNGWLNMMEMFFYDFVGLMLVYLVGGWGVFVGVLFFGFCFVKFYNGKIYLIFGYFMFFVMIGVFFLWFGWFGFNGGLVFFVNLGLVFIMFMMICFVVVVGGVVVVLILWVVLKKFDFLMVFNGIFVGLVGIMVGVD